MALSPSGFVCSALLAKTLGSGLHDEANDYDVAEKEDTEVGNAWSLKHGLYRC